MVILNLCSPQWPSSVKACEERSRDNNMKLNASKRKEMRVNFSFSSPSYPPIVIDNQTVNIVKHAKILGVIASNDLKWILHVNAICKKASKLIRFAAAKKKRSLGHCLSQGLLHMC